MDDLRLILKNKEADPEWFDALYAKKVRAKVRRKYDIEDELAIQRQKDRKPEKFAEYDAYIEQCIAEAKAELGIQ